MKKKVLRDIFQGKFAGKLYHVSWEKIPAKIEEYSFVSIGLSVCSELEVKLKSQRGSIKPIRLSFLDKNTWHDNIQDAIKYKKRSDSAAKEMLEHEISELKSNIVELELDIKEKQKELLRFEEALK